MEKIPSFNACVQKSIIDHWDLDALTDFKGQTLQYHDVARKIEKLHIKEIKLHLLGATVLIGLLHS